MSGTSNNLDFQTLVIDGFGDPQTAGIDGVGQVVGQAPGNNIPGPDGRCFIDTDIVDPHRTFVVTTLSGDGKSLISSDMDDSGRGVFESALDTTAVFSASYTSGKPNTSGNGEPFSLLPPGADPAEYSLLIEDVVVDPGREAALLVEFELRSLDSQNDEDGDPEVAIERAFFPEIPFPTDLQFGLGDFVLDFPNPDDPFPPADDTNPNLDFTNIIAAEFRVLGATNATISAESLELRGPEFDYGGRNNCDDSCHQETSGCSEADLILIA